VELSLEGEAVTARSLRCTHFGCEVRWDEDEALYRCPCHEGLFDAQGRPVAGPPPRPLRTYRASVTADEIVVGDEIPR
jgi:Rieske Fe-S protein